MGDLSSTNTKTRRNETYRAVALTIPALLLLALEPAKIPDSLLVLGTTAFWMTSFAQPTTSTRAMGTNLLFTASMLTFLLPVGMIWWQVLLVVSFGVVMGEQMFGGRRYSFLSPVIVALAFQFYSFTELREIAANTVALQILLIPMLLLLWSRQVNWQALLGVIIGFVSTAWIVLGTEPLQAWLLSPPQCATAVAACLVLVACDPAISPRSQLGRWVYGVLIGALQYVFDPTTALLEKTVFACLLGSVAAPLIDWLVVALLQSRKATDQMSEQHARD